MIRLLATPPASFDLVQLRGEAPAGCVDVNRVGDEIAAYWTANPPTVEAWQAIVTAHVPVLNVDLSPEERITELEGTVATLLAVIAGDTP